MSVIIFDFDGTIADSRDYFVNFIAKEANRLPLSEAEQDDLQGLSLFTIARRLGQHWWQMPRLYFKGRKRMDSVIPDLKPFRGMIEVVNKLHAEGHELFIVSSNSVRNIRRFLKRHHIYENFLEIYGGAEVFGKSRTIRQLLKRNNLTVKESILICDELRDIQAAQSLNMRTLAVTWGFSSEKIIEHAKPTAIARSPQDIISILSEI
jgi:HAD superfamily hydrolase (TIGR01549 family)